MSSIPPLDQVVRALRAQSLLEKAAPQALKKPEAAAPEREARRTTSDAANHVIQQVRAIAGEDPGRRRRAFRAFLEGRLIDLMGRDVLHAPGFPALLEQVHATMSSSKDMARAMDEVADLLLADALNPAALRKLIKAFRPPGDAPAGRG